MRLFELSMRAGDLSKHLSAYFNQEIKNIESYEHIGDIENIQVFRKDYGTSGILYILKKGEECISFSQVFKLSEKRALVKNTFTVEKYRRQHAHVNFLFFLKRNEGYSEIELGDIHSKDTLQVIPTLSKRFQVSWENKKSQEKIKYDSAEEDKYYSSSKPTGWVILLENDGDFSEWPKFFDESKLNTKQYYYWLFQD